ncbi:LysR family transcriptional regulator [Azospirillum sp. RWY-5-1]|uniref:LysR family transcriptional regulator n=1 Tax=Azospirillum oleiclasticum TaxID=2735135 RepID=A0ABX2TME2_9PROT|nr:LysR family transcriptional regulator [Azospirillum oleiclasticum]NYZ24786.1 LysR family transcriptional regulator [Azospirillum oleiclasticum]
MTQRNLDIDLLRSFVTIADAGNFTRAAERLGRAQSTISLQMKRLEETLGRSLLERNAHGVRITGEGEALLGYARRILALNDEAVGRLTEPELEGMVRLGTPEDFATTHLPAVLSAFAHSHPRVALEVTTDLTLNLLERFQGGEFDLVLVKREPMGPMQGMRVWREPLVWAALDRPSSWMAASPGDALPLVVSPHPCVYRKRALAALDSCGRRWRIAYTSTSLAGAQAAVRAGLGVTVLPRDMVPAGLVTLGGEDGLPVLDDTEIALIEAPGTRSVPARRLAGHIVSSLERGMGPHT